MPSLLPPVLATIRGGLSQAPPLGFGPFADMQWLNCAPMLVRRGWGTLGNAQRTAAGA